MAVKCERIERQVRSFLCCQKETVSVRQCISKLHKAVISKSCQVNHDDGTVVKAIKDGFIHPRIGTGLPPHLNCFIAKVLNNWVKNIPKKALDSIKFRYHVI